MRNWFMAAIAAASLVAMPAAVQAQAQEQQEIVDRATVTAKSMLTHPDFKDAQAMMRRAKGVIVIPSLVKAGFIVGGEGGSGVLLVRGKDGSWSNPSFVTMAAGSVGLQIGVQASELLLLIMTERGLQSVLQDEFKLGADASVAVGPIGAGVEAATTANLRADIYSYTRSKGAFGGVSLEGSLLKPRYSWNELYYGRPATARQVVVLREVSNPNANALRQALAVR